MAGGWKSALERWVSAGIIDAALAERIRAFEAEREEPQRMRLPVLFAAVFGGLLVGTGALLYVAARWDDFSPSARFALVLALVPLFHLVGAALTEKFGILSKVLHAVGSIVLGPAIFLAADIFSLQEHWPGALMLWTIGTGLGWLLLRDWPHAALTAILAPLWLAGEWIVATEPLKVGGYVATQGLLLLMLTYLTARTEEGTSRIRRALMWIGAVWAIPCALFVIGMARDIDLSGGESAPYRLLIPGLCLALGIPCALAYWLRRGAAWMNLVAALWVFLLGLSSRRNEGTENALLYVWQSLDVYLCAGLGAIGMIAWGVYEARRERINLGVAGFAVTVMEFYFESVMDQLGRSMALISLGLIFLVGGWFLEKARRTLVARVTRRGV